MDKLRALVYCLAAAQEKSFSGAARRLEVSPAAVAKLVATLERNLGAQLFERSPSGLTLTASGAGYLEACSPALDLLGEADEQARAASARAPGVIVVGVQHAIASGCLTRALPRFHARYPEITLDIRDFSRITEEETSGIDIFLVMGWPQLPNLVQRHIAAGRFIVVASPDYWARQGMPQRPQDLERHVCLPIRALDGTLMDLWRFKRGEEQVSISVRTWLLSANTHRDMTIQLALAGEGVMRILDWTNLDNLAAGTLVQALGDWESPEAPPVNLLFRPSVRRNPRGAPVHRLRHRFVPRSRRRSGPGRSLRTTGMDRQTLRQGVGDADTRPLKRPQLAQAAASVWQLPQPRYRDWRETQPVCK